MKAQLLALLLGMVFMVTILGVSAMLQPADATIQPTVTPCTTPTTSYSDGVKTIEVCGAQWSDVHVDYTKATPFPVGTLPAGFQSCLPRNYDVNVPDFRGWECINPSHTPVGEYYIAIPYNSYLDFATPTP